MNGKVVNWIESKAMFGDSVRHKKYLKNQLWSYWNRSVCSSSASCVCIVSLISSYYCYVLYTVVVYRFGPGLVIYWFGYVDDLEDNSSKGILVSDDFPEDFTLMEAQKSDS